MTISLLGQMTLKIIRGCAPLNHCDYMYNLRSSRHLSCYACSYDYCNVY